MKRIFKYGLVVFAGLAMISCAEKNIDLPAGDMQLVPMVVSAGISQTSDNTASPVSAAVGTKVLFDPTATKEDGKTYTKLTWRESGEKFSMTLNASGTVYLFEQTSEGGETASFEGNMPECSKSGGNAGTYPYAYYPAIESSNFTPTKWPINVASQTGAYNEDMTYMYFKSPVNYKIFSDVENSFANPQSIQFKHMLSILKLTLDFGAETTGTVSNIKFSGEGLLNAGQFNVSTGVWVATGQTVGDISISNGIELVDGKAIVCLYLIPSEISNFKVSAELNDMNWNATINEAARTSVAGKEYSKNVSMEKEATSAAFTILADYGNNYSYNGLDMTVGKVGEEGKTVTVADNQAVYSESLKFVEGDKIFVCVPRVAKFFHTVTATEANLNKIVLPDKNAGSTLLTGEADLIAGKPYKNDWIVALYLGIDSDVNAGAPLYWATGNLIAVKTTEAGAATEVAYFIADAKISAEENVKENPYKLWPAKDADGFLASPAGTMWDGFQAATSDAARRLDNTNHTNGWTSEKRAFAGDADVDICAANLGGTWRLPTFTSTASNGTGAGDGGEVWDFMDKAVKSTYYEYTYVDSESNITNKVQLPLAGCLSKIEDKPADANRFNRAFYMSGNIAGSGNLRVFDSNAKNTSVATNWLFTVRPVTE